MNSTELVVEVCGCDDQRGCVRQARGTRTSVHSVKGVWAVAVTMHVMPQFNPSLQFFLRHSEHLGAAVFILNLPEGDRTEDHNKS
jgi:hypothetical protein